ncbi:hypothetical protein HanOQP8_Chr09g0324941 [Helianthus annuus]|nr:hypothetical protein HanOQP8_Chr09g0324941 [Helianthus annuus]
MCLEPPLSTYQRLSKHAEAPLAAAIMAQSHTWSFSSGTFSSFSTCFFSSSSNQGSDSSSNRGSKFSPNSISPATAVTTASTISSTVSSFDYPSSASSPSGIDSSATKH